MSNPHQKVALFASAEAVEEAFYEALERADVDAVMALWSEDEEPVCIHPSGPRLIGLTAIRQSWEQILEQGPVHIRPIDLHIVQSGAISVHNMIEQIVVHGTESTQMMQVSTTNVYVKGPLGWQMVIHHAGSPVETIDAELQLNLAGGTLH
jgi:ketosteroid isomerase-like protein